ncbi:MAG TPA: protein translocase subunit SecD [Acidimicrobiales bacterium]|nr:protein translocase subunit SecD [Acidimicrobiales bacterium]
MSPPSSRAPARRQRAWLTSVIVVVVLAVGSLAATLGLKWHPLLGLDLAGGLSVIYKPAHPVSQSDLNEVVTILTNRVDALGVSGAQVGTQGGNVVVSIPGVKNPQQILNTIGQTAQLLFRPVECFAPAYTAPRGRAASAAATLPTCGAGYQLSQANIAVTPNSSTAQGYTANSIPPDPAFAAVKSAEPSADKAGERVLLPGLPGAGAASRYVLGPSQMTGHSLKGAQAQQTQAGAWVVNYSLSGAAGSQLWDKVAQQNFHQYLAIELDGVVQSAPIIQPAQTSFSSFQGQGEISGSLTETEAKTLALAMQFGSLPVRLDALTTQTVSPTLGKSSLVAGLGAGIAGLVLVLLYVIGYYRALGLVVITGLALTAALLWAIVAVLGHTQNLTLDLAGVTGLIVSIGITVDSYIVYFERLKDETRAGRTIRTSVERSFASAWRTVLAADLVSLLGAVLLWMIAIGAVRGFAFFLGLSTLLDIVITYFFTRPLVILLGRSERITGARRFGVARGLAVGADS